MYSRSRRTFQRRFSETNDGVHHRLFRQHGPNAPDVLHLAERPRVTVQLGDDRVEALQPLAHGAFVGSSLAHVVAKTRGDL